MVFLLHSLESTALITRRKQMRGSFSVVVTCNINHSKEKGRSSSESFYLLYNYICCPVSHLGLICVPLDDVAVRNPVV